MLEKLVNFFLFWLIMTLACLTVCVVVSALSIFGIVLRTQDTTRVPETALVCLWASLIISGLFGLGAAWWAYTKDRKEKRLSTHT